MQEKFYSLFAVGFQMLENSYFIDFQNLNNPVWGLYIIYVILKVEIDNSTFTDNS